MSWIWRANRRASPRRPTPSRPCPSSSPPCLRQRRLELNLNDDVVNTSALANALMILGDNKVSLVSIRSIGQQTEQAFLDLVEKEELRGFARLYQPEEAA